MSKKALLFTAFVLLAAAVLYRLVDSPLMAARQEPKSRRGLKA